MNAKKGLFASCFGCMSAVKYADESAGVEGLVKAPKRGKSRVKQNLETKDQVLDMDTSSKPPIEPPTHDTVSSSRGADGAEKGNESPSSHFRNTPSVASESEAEDTFEEKENQDNEPTQQSPLPPLVLDSVITSGEKTREDTRAVYLGNRQSKSDVTNGISAVLRTETPVRRRMQIERESRLSCHPVMLRAESFVSSSSSGSSWDDDEGREECASDFE